jgi:hypothetical protein
MPPTDSPSIMIEGATLLFRNFAGLAREFNSEGDRNFSVILPRDLALKMKDAGWRVKQLKPREDEEEGDYHLKVKVNYKTGRPPRVVLITSNNRTDLGADEVSMVDVADIKNADLIINGYWNDMSGGGYTGYLKTLFLTINEDELEQKYQERKEDQE